MPPTIAPVLDTPEPPVAAATGVDEAEELVPGNTVIVIAFVGSVPVVDGPDVIEPVDCAEPVVVDSQPGGGVVPIVLDAASPLLPQAKKLNPFKFSKKSASYR